MSALTDIFSSIANAIRGRNGSQATYKPEEMANAINAINPVPAFTGVGVTKDQPTISVNRFFYNNEARCEFFLNNTNNTVYIGTRVTNMAQFSAGMSFLNGTRYTNYNEYIHNIVITSQKVTSMQGAFAYLTQLDCKINIPNTVTTLDNAFNNCISYKQPIYVPENVTQVGSMCKGCNNISDIYFNNSSKLATLQSVRRLLDGVPYTKRVNIHCGNASPFIQSGAYLKGLSDTWSTMENGYYNSAHNIYIYNNYGAR